MGLWTIPVYTNKVTHGGPPDSSRMEAGHAHAAETNHVNRGLGISNLPTSRQGRGAEDPAQPHGK